MKISRSTVGVGRAEFMEAVLIRGLVTVSQWGSTQTYLKDYVDCIWMTLRSRVPCIYFLYWAEQWPLKRYARALVYRIYRFVHILKNDLCQHKYLEMSSPWIIQIWHQVSL